MLSLVPSFFKGSTDRLGQDVSLLTDFNKPRYSDLGANYQLHRAVRLGCS